MNWVSLEWILPEIRSKNYLAASLQMVYLKDNWKKIPHWILNSNFSIEDMIINIEDIYDCYHYSISHDEI